MASPQIYFGNLRKAGWVKAPDSGLDATPMGVTESDSFYAGGSFSRNSSATHRTYGMSWNIGQIEEFQFLSNYRNGLHGTGLLYWIDPYAAYWNVLPPHWADPFLSAKGWPSLIGARQEPNAVKAPLVRTNWMINPSATAAVTGFTNNGTASTVTRTTAEFFTTPASISVAATAVGGGVIQSFGGVAGDWFGETVTGAFMVKAPVGVGMTGSIRAVSSDLAGSVVTFTGTGAWQRVDIPAVLNPTSVIPYLYVRQTGAGVNTFYVDNFQAEKGVTAITTLFDGSTPSTLLAQYAWTGAADASNSTATETYDWQNQPNGNPPYSAVYTISTPVGTVPDRSAVLLVPPTHQLSIGFTGSSAGGAVVRVQPVFLDGSPAPTQDMTLLSATGTTRMNLTFSGATYSAIKVYITQTISGTSQLTLLSGDAIYTAIGTTPVLVGNHREGRGHTGLKFAGDNSLTYTFFDDTGVSPRRYASAAAKFTEVGAWV